MAGPTDREGTERWEAGVEQASIDLAVVVHARADDAAATCASCGDTLDSDGDDDSCTSCCWLVLTAR